MKKSKKHRIAEIVMVVCCGIGCLLIASPKFIESELNLLSIGMTFNGVGIIALLYVVNQSKKAE